MTAAWFLLVPVSVAFGVWHRLGWGGRWPKAVAVVVGLFASAGLVYLAAGAPMPAIMDEAWFVATLIAGLHAQAYNLPGHGESMDMGTMGGTERGDFMAMFWRYVGGAAVIAWLLVSVASWWGIAFMLAGPIPAFGYRWAARRFAVNHTVYGEMILGGSWYGFLGLVAALSQ